MNWGCPFEIEGYCEKLKKLCKINQKGCVLHGKVKMVGLKIKGKGRRKK